MLLRLGRAEHARIRERKKNHREHAARHEDDENRAIEKALARLHRRLDHLIAFLIASRPPYDTQSPGPRRVPNLCTRSTLSPRMTDAVILPVSGRDSSASVRAGV